MPSTLSFPISTARFFTKGSHEGTSKALRCISMQQRETMCPISSSLSLGALTALSSAVRTTYKCVCVCVCVYIYE